MTSAQDFISYIYEGDEAATISGTGGCRNTNDKKVKFGGVSPVDTSPEMKDAKAMTDDKGTKGFDKSNRPNNHRPSHIDFPGQSYSPSNPVRQPGLRDMWQKELERTTREAQRRQSGNYLNRKS